MTTPPGTKEFFAKVGKTPRVRKPAVPEEATEKPLAAMPEGGPIGDGLCRWSARDNVFWTSGQSYKELPPGLYKCRCSSDIGPFLQRQEVKTDELILLPEPTIKTIIEQFETFWTLKPEFDARGFLHKRGILLWGPPGSGKTSTINLMTEIIVNKYEGLVIYIENAGNATACLQMIRRIEPKRRLIAIMEDLDALVEREGEEGFLAMLDGESQVDNIVYVGTTNYPERLDPRFVDRPSRFDTIHWLGMPSAASRKLYLKTKEPTLSESDLEEWVKLSSGLSVAHLREMIIAVRCFGQPLKAVVERLQLMHERTPSSQERPDRPNVGLIPQQAEGQQAIPQTRRIKSASSEGAA